MSLVTSRLHTLGNHSVPVRIGDWVIRHNVFDATASSAFAEIAVNLGKRIEKGVFVGVDDNGALLLKQGDKEIKIMAGDIWFNED